MSNMVAEVLVSVSAKSVDRTFQYLVPDKFVDNIGVGNRVLVSFGPRKIQGFVIGLLLDVEACDYELKPILALVDNEPLLNEEMLEMGKYLRTRTLCSLISAYQAMLPSALKGSTKSVPIKTEVFLRLNRTESEIREYIEHNRRSKKQNELLLFLLENNDVSKRNVPIELTNSVKSLASLSLIDVYEKEVYRIQSEDSVREFGKELNTEQQVAVSTVVDHLSSFLVYLLYGVSGSGKTEVYMQIISEVLNSSKTVLMLVPEISLTPQIIGRFRDRFGADLAMIHSSLSLGERYDEWRKIKRGEVKIVIGTRSAIFAPLENIGLIVMDEEHSDTYKQDNNPRYHTKDVAQWRAMRHGCPLILGSATPSLESFARAQTGQYQLLTLKNRVNKNMPSVTIVDMKLEIKKGNSLFSDLLVSEIENCLSRNEQIILLLNRRGYSTYLNCRNCGHVPTCPHCEISLTYHKSRDVLRCHYCGYALRNLLECPDCHSQDIKQMGIGTEKVEEELHKRFSARVIRMDMDTTSRKGSHEKIVDSFKRHEYDILLGTQVIAKGHDFPNVTLVGVFSGDSSLNIPDFRSSERTFQLLCQTAGRAGRSDKKGCVVIQAYNPDHYSIQYAKRHDYLSFYQHEVTLRRKLKYPPFYNIVVVKISSKDYEKGVSVSRKIRQYLDGHLNDEVIVLGPSPSVMFKCNNVYSFQCVVKFKSDPTVLTVMENIVLHYAADHQVSVDIDTNPQRL